MKFFSADLHVGEESARGNPSYYRAFPPHIFQHFFINKCHNLYHLQPTDELHLVGDLVTNLDNLEFYKQLPNCQLYIYMGNKEKAIPDFADRAREILSPNFDKLEIIPDWATVEINGRIWRVGHRPEDIANLSPSLPCICGHVHSFWRTRKLSSGLPIINVGVDIWCDSLVTEEFIELQYEGIVSGRFDKILNFEK